MDNYSNEEFYPDNSYNEDANFRNGSMMEVTDGLFSRCEKKNEKREDSTKKEVTKKSSRVSSHACEQKPKRKVNPYIYFYMELYKKNAGKHVTCVAKEAGKRWNCMSEKEKQRYRDLANAHNDANSNAAANAAASRYPKLNIDVKRKK
ncbi:uncharacterized protein LOC122498281 [Leptopilina heterotoma]|uniref:uncharacterized protein LOC122498281 n=1 Tax=Leptopilina heterotoma TaxID=63436 RepID=UPI001CA8E03D|nr:uncharacterized protein LOC122498281 [Leptopilina heterotoma]